MTAQDETARIAAVRRQVRSECLAASNQFGPAFFDQHLVPVVDWGRRLAERIGADPVVVELGGWLHDLSAVREIATIPTHALEGARIARDLLAAQGWPADRVAAVGRAIESHSAPVTIDRGTPEEVCLSNADALAQIARPAYWLYYLYGVRGVDWSAGIAWLESRIDGVWRALAPEARELGAADRAALARLLEVARAQP